MQNAFTIRPYTPADESGWLRCRVLSFLDTPYFDDVRQTKEHYPNRAIELVAVAKNLVVGLIDVECDSPERTVCWHPGPPGGSIWHIAVHPDFRKEGIGKALLEAARQSARDLGLARFEAWTRAEASACGWYEAIGFEKVFAYLQVFFDYEEASQIVQCTSADMRIIHGLCHYRGTDVQSIRSRFKRTHECRLYELGF